MRCCYLQVLSLSISFTFDEMVHLVISCVQKTKNIQVFFEKTLVSGDFQSSLPLRIMTQTITKKDHRS